MEIEPVDVVGFFGRNFVIYDSERMPKFEVLMLRIRPHPACLDGEDDGGLAAKRRQIHDPIRLVRMVKKIVRLVR